MPYLGEMMVSPSVYLGWQTPLYKCNNNICLFEQLHLTFILDFETNFFYKNNTHGGKFQKSCGKFTERPIYVCLLFIWNFMSFIEQIEVFSFGL